jgi:hypothetical protein
MLSLPTTDYLRRNQLVRDSCRAFSPNLAGSDCDLFKKYQISLIRRLFDDEDALFQRMMLMLNDDRDAGFDESIVQLDARIQRGRTI